MVCDIVQLAVHVSEKIYPGKDFLRILKKAIKENSLPFHHGLISKLASDIEAAVRKHANEQCDQCVLPGSLSIKAEKLFFEKGKDSKSKTGQKSFHNWPDNRPFFMKPLLAKTDDFVIFCIPKRKVYLQGVKLSLFEKNVTAKSEIIQ